MYDHVGKGSSGVADANIESRGSKHGLFSISSALIDYPTERFFPADLQKTDMQIRLARKYRARNCREPTIQRDLK